jgi:hypothetical protein
MDRCVAGDLKEDKGVELHPCVGSLDGSRGWPPVWKFGKNRCDLPLFGVIWCYSASEATVFSTIGAAPLPFLWHGQDLCAGEWDPVLMGETL